MALWSNSVCSCTHTLRKHIREFCAASAVRMGKDLTGWNDSSFSPCTPAASDIPLLEWKCTTPPHEYMYMLSTHASTNTNTRRRSQAHKLTPPTCTPCTVDQSEIHLHRGRSPPATMAARHEHGEVSAAVMCVVLVVEHLDLVWTIYSGRTRSV